MFRTFLSIIPLLPVYPGAPISQRRSSTKQQQHAVFILYVQCKTTTVCKRISLVTGGKHFSKSFSIFYMLNSKNRVFNPYFFNWYLSNEKMAFVDRSRVEPSIFFIEKYHFLWNFSLVIFMGNPSLRLSKILMMLVSKLNYLDLEPYWHIIIQIHTPYLEKTAKTEKGEECFWP